MECVICKHGTTRSSFVTVTLERDNCIVILKQVPADICQNCGEYYLSESVTAEVLQKAEDAVNKGAEVEIIRYVA
ncbi:MAG: type II toxin-antitoxin system MqsA family antitoxin [Microcystis sp. M114S2]|jgi:YgiT-type zinc finger domain-containing protein|uniref:Type II toxin-antitoxin system MqsA family antitoxin n=1 Tax=Microcystis aeruginosa NIES-44 TaxID=449439 RepID=A0A0A1VSM0_MICAE|nr:MULTISPECIES: type II toxin-antitoxin system MqsA family antitoxin [Microcystis]MCA2666024.1 type II toxin-antitoxin system MqsA family antitoxin [Microcystis sp. M045S2]MCA2713270.1 type II toxin-antitoxin system MqsA family antitoxin [Microcystis sp. M172S2]MCA2803994.1 type II toxin-antitoxin system MqsA family antitoxin [Microcystis sp. M114S2]MCA2832544.1 type II toxin-antitoxin system MqsA family antitoxin [Microcystis sp. M007S1]MCA2839948.1 type II toxin-antitoxin system MqsA family